MFVAKSQRVCQYWQSAEKSNASVALVTVSRFFRALPIMAGYSALQQKILADLRFYKTNICNELIWVIFKMNCLFLQKQSIIILKKQNYGS